jgi:hypothetical protein
MNKKLFVAPLALLVFTSINAGSAQAQSRSCPVETFGSHPTSSVDKSVQAEIEVTYFTTNDPNVFISERAGLNRSASYMKLDTNQFVAKIEMLRSEGVATIRKREQATSYLGQTAELNLERTSSGARTVNAGFVSPAASHLNRLDRSTEISVDKGRAGEGDSYRLRLLSWFVQATNTGVQKTVDYDANVLLKPGQTALIKLTSDFERQRSGAARSYMAVTMRSVNNGNVASVRRSRSTVAFK